MSLRSGNVLGIDLSQVWKRLKEHDWNTNPIMPGGPIGMKPEQLQRLRDWFQSSPQPQPQQPTQTRPVEDTFENAPTDVGRKLTELEKRLKPTYTVNVGGTDVSAEVPAHFRMNGGDGQISPEQAVKKQTEALRNVPGLNRAGLTDAISRNAYGRATPEQVKQVTEALIKAGKLNPYLDELKTQNGGTIGPDQLRTAVRRMQFEYGVGIDCNGATQLAYREVYGKNATRHWGDALINVDKSGNSLNPNFRKVGLNDAQPGDVIKLSTPGSTIGHNVMVTNVTQLSKEDAQSLEGDPRPQGPLKRLTVFSSWGANGDRDNPKAGVRREDWVYDEGSQRWGMLKGNKVEWSSSGGPYNHDLVGIYRGT